MAVLGQQSSQSEIWFGKKRYIPLNRAFFYNVFFFSNVIESYYVINASVGFFLLFSIVFVFFLFNIIIDFFILMA